MSVPPNNTEQLVAWNRVQQSSLRSLKSAANSNIFDEIQKNIDSVHSGHDQNLIDQRDTLKQVLEENELYQLLLASRELKRESIR